MSGHWNEERSAAVWAETHVRSARSHHTCSACDELISPGAPYSKTTRIDERGDAPEVWKRCARCEKIYVHLLMVCGEDEPLPDLRCGHDYEERHGKPPPPEIAALAFALPTGPGATPGDEP